MKTNPNVKICQLFNTSVLFYSMLITTQFDPKLCNQASNDVLLHYIRTDYPEILPNWLFPLFFSLDTHCAAGELDIVSQHCWFVCVSAMQLFSTI